MSCGGLRAAATNTCLLVRASKERGYVEAGHITYTHLPLGIGEFSRKASLKINGFYLGLPCGLAGKESACNAGNPGSIPRVGKIPWRRERLPTSVFWPGEFHGLYSPPGHKELDTTE